MNVYGKIPCRWVKAIPMLALKSDWQVCTILFPPKSHFLTGIFPIRMCAFVRVCLLQNANTEMKRNERKRESSHQVKINDGHCCFNFVRYCSCCCCTRLGRVRVIIISGIWLSINRSKCFRSANKTEHWKKERERVSAAIFYAGKQALSM